TCRAISTGTTGGTTTSIRSPASRSTPPRGCTPGRSRRSRATTTRWRPAVGDRGLPQSLPRGRDPQHGPDPRGDLLPGGARRRLRGRRPLRLPARRAPAAGDARGGDADQPVRLEMTDREEAGRKALEFSENLWKDGDFWELETSEYERGRYAR